MKIKTTCSANWVIYQPVSSAFSIEDILEISDRDPDSVLREHHRSQVLKVNSQGNSYVVKTPNNKNKSLWIQFTTLYRNSEVVKDLKSQLLLNSLKIKTVEPVAALEIRKFGAVVNSKIIYQFKEGSQISTAHFPAMIFIMKTLHNNGYLHDDPHTKNFLQHNHEVFAIDCKPRNNMFGQIGIAHNFITLARRSPNSQEIYQLIGMSPSSSKLYKLVNNLINLQQIRRSIKNKFKLMLGLDYKR